MQAHDNRLRIPPAAWLGGVAAASLIALASPPARAVDLLGVYAGAAVGDAHVAANTSGVIPDPGSLDHFGAHHTAYKLIAGVRPVSLFGAEIEYLDLGHPSQTYGGPGLLSADVSTKGAAGFGVLYLPIPVVDVFLKGGVARLDTRVNERFCGVDLCQSGGFYAHDTGFAGGVGVQLKLGPLAGRAEFERFATAGANPYLYSIGLTYNFF